MTFTLLTPNGAQEQITASQAFGKIATFMREVRKHSDKVSRMEAEKAVSEITTADRFEAIAHDENGVEIVPFMITKDERVLPIHADPMQVEAIQDEHPGAENPNCKGSLTATTTGECVCGRMFCTDTCLPIIAELAGDEACPCAAHSAAVV